MNGRAATQGSSASARAPGRRWPGLLALVALVLGVQPVAAQQVTLPLPEYRALRERAYPPPDRPPEPPAPVALESAALEVVAGASSARVTYRLNLSLYGEGWQSVPLPSTGSFVAATFGDLEGRLSDGTDGRSLLVRGSGSHQVTLEAVLPLERDETATRPTWHLRLGMPAAAVVFGTLTVGKAVREVEGSGSIVLAREQAPEQAARWSFVGAPGDVASLTLTGEATVPERARLPLRFEATAATASTLTQTRLVLHAWVEARVLQGELGRLDLPVPDGLEVVAVDSLDREDVAGWDVEAGTLRITPLEPVRDRFSVAIELAGSPVTELASPSIAPEGAARTLFASKVAVEGDGLLTLLDAGAGARPDSRQAGRLPEPFRSAPGRAFVVPEFGAPPRWQVTWAEGTQVLAAQVDRLLVHYLVGEAGRAHLEVWAVVRNSGADRLSPELPPAAELLAASRDGVPLTPGRAPGREGDAWAVPLASTSKVQVVHLSALVPVALPEGDGTLSFALPRLSAPASRVEVRAALPPGRTYELTEGERSGAVGPPPAVGGARETPPELAQQVLSQVALATPVRARPVPVPPGFVTLEAAWSALSSAPPPLVVKLDRERERWRWQ